MSASLQLTPESLCDRLDHLSIQKLELMNKLIRCGDLESSRFQVMLQRLGEKKYQLGRRPKFALGNMMLEKSMRNGFFFLGKTRYSLGTNAVSALQLPNEERELDALATAVTTPTPLEGYDGEILFQQVDIRFQDPIITAEEKEPPEDDSGALDNQNEGLRKRQKNSDKVKKVENEENETSYLDSRDKVKTINRDPIRWFSALPPQTLRRAQSEFKSAVQLSAHCATVRSKLCSVNKEFERLVKIKVKFEQLEKEP